MPLPKSIAITPFNGRGAPAVAPDASQSQTVLTRREAAGVLKVSTRTIDRLLDRGALRAVRIGRSVRIPKTELERFVMRP
jgi:excisionase family DNA binding protein